MFLGGNYIYDTSSHVELHLKNKGSHVEKKFLVGLLNETIFKKH